MTMRIKFIKDYDDPVIAEVYKKGDEVFLPRKLGIYLVRNEFAIPFAEQKVTEDQVLVDVETRETAVKKTTTKKVKPK